MNRGMGAERPPPSGARSSVSGSRSGSDAGHTDGSSNASPNASMTRPSPRLSVSGRSGGGSRLGSSLLSCSGALPRSLVQAGWEQAPRGAALGERPMSTFSVSHGRQMSDQVFRQSELATSGASEPPLPREPRLEPTPYKPPRKAPTVCEGRFTLVNKLGSGAFGQVFSATDSTAKGALVALKFEKPTGTTSQLATEYRLYKLLQQRGGGRGRPPGVPALYHAGIEKPYNILAVELLGPCLLDLLMYCGMHFSEKTSLMLAMQMLRLLQNIHDVGYVHRDLKPENFVMGLGPRANTVYLIDFGLARQYRDRHNMHVPFRTGCGFAGTARYSCLAAHLGHEQGRKDDLEALVYVLAYLRNGSLPWQGIPDQCRVTRKAHITEKKAETPSGKILGLLPKCFTSVFTYIKRLKFNDAPDYDHVHDILEKAYYEKFHVKDWRFDWFEAARGRGVSMVK